MYNFEIYLNTITITVIYFQISNFKFQIMLRQISKIGLIALPAFMACHLIKENKNKMKTYCPVVKFNNSKNNSKNKKE